MRNRLRFFWLWLVREYEASNAYCFNCGKRGANVSSIMYPKRLCDGCATAACRRADVYVHVTTHNSLDTAAEKAEYIWRRSMFKNKQ
jgi:hypothetical protein